MKPVHVCKWLLQNTVLTFRFTSLEQRLALDYDAIETSAIETSAAGNSFPRKHQVALAFRRKLPRVEEH